MLVDKDRVRDYYLRLKEYMVDLCHVLDIAVEEWLRRANNLKMVGALYHYMILMRKAKDYIKQNCPCYLKRFESIKKRVNDVPHPIDTARP